jgi:hypothetical protein
MNNKIVTNEKELYSVLAYQMPDVSHKYIQDWWWKDYSRSEVDTSWKE